MFSALKKNQVDKSVNLVNDELAETQQKVGFVLTHPTSCASRSLIQILSSSNLYNIQFCFCCPICFSRMFASGTNDSMLISQVNKLKDQCQKQEETIKEQEGELDSRKQELQKLKEEEQALEKEYDSSLKEKEKISTQLQDTHVQISQVRAMVSQLEEIQRQMKDALLSCKAAVDENNATMVSDYSLTIEPEFRDFKRVLTSPEEKPKERES
jgi:vacuolar-type H+-ATPase subunit I/STV1